ncbi:Holliday junction branch migration protein RuvA [Compostimonas suwonensis]|uniref:Holliday junction branch migration complex subunit RuvA n=1 Tax=Compostimonas suwonensis TaxID=1048394 RepID=A0A2M9BBT0_9MICO|nr:Holliday junction branch migration protein RuvA [Compostimonas suwonensis]PJJ55397.1 Holliday junction DNA helicase RuvA [Compostimonas suwonensis]
MISSLRGTVLSTTATSVVLEVGGVGFSVQVTPDVSLSLRVGAEAFLMTSLVVREDSLSLFGFATAEQLEVFSHLVAVTGVGPKSALGVLAVLSPEEIARAVAADDDAAFRKVSGIGPKTAKLIVVSLTGKLAFVQRTSLVRSPRTQTSVADSVVEALVGLGWSERVAIQAVEDAAASATETELATVPALLRLALASLGPAHSTGGRRP